MELSPAFSITSDMTDEELDLYFATCGSLSNLPTPPPAKEHATKKLASTTSDQHEFAPKLQGQLPTIQRRTITRATFLLKDKFVVGLEHVGLARQSDVPLHYAGLDARHGSSHAPFPPQHPYSIIWWCSCRSDICCYQNPLPPCRDSLYCHLLNSLLT